MLSNYFSTPEHIHRHMFACQRYILTTVMFFFLLYLFQIHLNFILHFYHYMYQFVDNISTDIHGCVNQSLK